jgi:phage regulator Rha-like protein
MEIAERTGKRHDHVLADTRKMLTELHGEGELPRFEECYKAADNNMHPMYRLPRYECLVLIAGYNIPLRPAIIKRLEELTAGTTP